METMTGRERIMTALRNGRPDRVPATPDISIMVPTRLTGRPSWEVEYNQNPSLQSAYIQAAGGEGGFVLSTGDQCGRDTPDENIFEMVRVAK